LATGRDLAYGGNVYPTFR